MKIKNRSKFVLILIIALLMSCTAKQNIIKTKTNNNSKNDIKPENKNNIEKIDKRYLIEGFLSKNIFRVVIVSTKDETENEFDEITKKAKNRASITLRKYIISKTSRFSNKCERKLNLLIERKGSMKKQDIEYKYDVYYFEIKTKNIKNKIEKIYSN
jgi:hypothetical protein